MSTGKSVICCKGPRLGVTGKDSERVTDGRAAHMTRMRRAGQGQGWAGGEFGGFPGRRLGGDRGDGVRTGGPPLRFHRAL